MTAPGEATTRTRALGGDSEDAGDGEIDGLGEGRVNALGLGGGGGLELDGATRCAISLRALSR